MRETVVVDVVSGSIGNGLGAPEGTVQVDPPANARFTIVRDRSSVTAEPDSADRVARAGEVADAPRTTCG